VRACVYVCVIVCIGCAGVVWIGVAMGVGVCMCGFVLLGSGVELCRWFVSCGSVIKAQCVEYNRSQRDTHTHTHTHTHLSIHVRKCAHMHTHTHLIHTRENSH